MPKKLTIEYDLEDDRLSFAVEIIISAIECNPDLVSKVTYGDEYGDDLIYKISDGFNETEELKKARGFKILKDLLSPND